MKKRLRWPSPILAAVTALVAIGPAAANDQAIERCRQERAAEQRLACYDAIQTTPRSSSAAPAAAAVPAPASAAGSRFGLPAASSDADGVNSSISGRFEGWGPKTQFKLANGQVWEVEDGSSASLWLDSPKVRVRRGFAGAFYIELEGSNRSPRVRRIK